MSAEYGLRQYNFCRKRNNLRGKHFVRSAFSIHVNNHILICIHRIKTSDGSPITLMKNYILESLVPNLDTKQEVPHLYDFLWDKYHIRYTASRDTISACNASFEQAQLLEIQPRDALITVCRICYMGKRPCEVDVVNIIADRYEYEVFVGQEQI